MAAENNPFYVAPPNVYQALMSGMGGYNQAYQQQQQNDIRQARADAANLLASGDQQGAMAKLLRFDPQGAAVLSHIYQQSPAGITASETAKAKVAAEYAPKITTIKHPTLGEVSVTMGPDGKLAPVDVSGAGLEPPNPFAAPGKQTGDEALAGGYARRMFNAEGIIRPLEDVGTSSFEKGLEKIPYGIGHYFSSEDAKKYDQAKRNFVSGVLRRESGKLISPKEYEQADLQYFPQPGDSKAVIEQKRAARSDAIREVAATAGRTFKSPFTFGANNEMIPAAGPSGTATAGVPKIPATPAVLAKARAAIAQGADPAAVAKKMADKGIDPSGL